MQLVAFGGSKTSQLTDAFWRNTKISDGLEFFWQSNRVGAGVFFSFFLKNFLVISFKSKIYVYSAVGHFCLLLLFGFGFSYWQFNDFTQGFGELISLDSKTPHSDLPSVTVLIQPASRRVFIVRSTVLVLTLDCIATVSRRALICVVPFTWLARVRSVFNTDFMLRVSPMKRGLVSTRIIAF